MSSLSNLTFRVASLLNHLYLPQNDYKKRVPIDCNWEKLYANYWALLFKHL